MIRILGIVLLAIVFGSVLYGVALLLSVPVLKALHARGNTAEIVALVLLCASYLFAAWVAVRSIRKHPAAAETSAVPRRSKLKAAAIAVIFIALAGAWVARLESDAEGSARAFCRSAPAGSPIAAVARAAEGQGEPKLRQVRPANVTVGFIGLPPFSRHFCTVEAKDGKVTRARYSTLD